MSRFSSRILQKTLRPHSAEGPPEQRGSKYRKYEFHPLMQVSIHHSYYNIPGQPCPDFEFAPTPTTQELMSNLGLLFRREPTGFLVLYDTRGTDRLLSYLRRHVDEQKEVWSWLSFMLTPQNVFFINFTDVDIGVEASEQNFYFSNQTAHEQDGRILLNPAGKDISTSLEPVLPAQVATRLDEDTLEVQVRDIANHVVLCLPRCVPRGLLRERARGPLTCQQVDDFFRKDPSPPSRRAGPRDCTDLLFVDFADLPGGRYSIDAVLNAYPLRVSLVHGVYEPVTPTPLCFIDLLFTAPSASSPGIYPVRNLFSRKEEAEIVPVHYELQFERRSTRWNYYIVPPAGAPFEHLRIIDPEHPQRDYFDGPKKEPLATGTQAYRFTAREKFALELHSSYRFQLRGRRPATLAHENVLVDRLPVASAQQVLSREASSSDIFVYL
jgi:hypothetical protein